MRETVQVKRTGVKVRHARVRWFLQINDSKYAGQKVLNMKLPGRKGKIAERFMDVEEDMRRARVTEEREARDRVRWSPMIHCRCALMTRCSYISQEMHVRLHFWYKVSAGFAVTMYLEWG